MSAPYVPASAGEMAGYLAAIVQYAAKDHPDDEGLARGLAAWEAWKAALVADDSDVPADRRCRRCGATQNLKTLFSGVGYSQREYECWDGCKDGAA